MGRTLGTAPGAGTQKGTVPLAWCVGLQCVRHLLKSLKPGTNVYQQAEASFRSQALSPTWKARARMLRAAGTSPANHLDLAPMSHSTSALGQWATALCNNASRDSLQDRPHSAGCPEHHRCGGQLLLQSSTPGVVND